MCLETFLLFMGKTIIQILIGSLHTIKELSNIEDLLPID